MFAHIISPLRHNLAQGSRLQRYKFFQISANVFSIPPSSTFLVAFLKLSCKHLVDPPFLRC